MGVCYFIVHVVTHTVNNYFLNRCSNTSVDINVASYLYMHELLCNYLSIIRKGPHMHAISEHEIFLGEHASRHHNNTMLCMLVMLHTT